MMNIIEKKMRTNVRAMAEACRACGYEVEREDEFSKWGNKTKDGGVKARMERTATIYRTNMSGSAQYFFTDSLDRSACTPVDDKEEIVNYLLENGYRPNKDWCIDELGMSEEDYEEYNK